MKSTYLYNCFIGILSLCLWVSCNGPTTISGGSASEGEARIVGRAVYPDGSPAAYASVAIHNARFLPDTQMSIEMSSRSKSFAAKTDKQGHFKLEKIRTGIYRIEISDGNRMGVLLPCTLESHDEKINLPTSTLDSTVTIEGMVVALESKEPITGLFVHMYGIDRIVTTSNDGAFSLPDVPYGTYMVRITPSTPSFQPTETNWFTISEGKSPFVLDTLFLAPRACRTYRCDSCVVAALLRTNGIDSLHVDSVSTYSPYFNRITTVTLHNTSISALSPIIASMDALEALYASKNSLTKLPSEIAELQKLRKLDISYNALTSLPQSLIELRNLEILLCNSNALAALPPKCSSWTNLRTLDIGNNRFDTLAYDLSHFHQLEQLYLSNNNVTTLPSEICSLTNLTVLDASSNKLTTIPSSIDRCVNLQRLVLHNNAITSIPPSLGACRALRFLYLDQNRLQSLPVQLVNLTSIEQFSCNNNNICSVSDALGEWIQQFDPTWRDSQSCQ